MPGFTLLAKCSLGPPENMIKTLTVKNFLSLREVSLDLTRRNVLVGPNASGKTNLLAALRFLTRFLSTNLSEALVEQQSLGNLTWLGENGENYLVEFSLLCDIPGLPETFKYSLKLQGSPQGSFLVESEHLELNKDGSRIKLISVERGQGTILHLDGQTAFAAPGPTHSALEFAVPGWYGATIKNLMARWQFYNLIPQVMKIPTAIKGDTHLMSDGSNFSSWFKLLIRPTSTSCSH